jgi:hypothetical protein
MNLSYSQNDSKKEQIVQNIVSVLTDLGFTQYISHFEQNYLVSTTDNEFASKDTQIGLDNLISICDQSDINEWTNIIRDHFMRIKSIKKEKDNLEPEMQNYETALQYLKIRIYPIDYYDIMSKFAILRKNDLGFLEAIVVDYPSTVESLKTEYLKKWDISENNIFNDVTKQTIDDIPEMFEKYEFKYNSNIYLLSSDTNIFVSTSILDLKVKAAPVGKYGSFVSIPNRVNVPVLELTDKTTINGLTVEFMMLTKYMYDKGPGSITSNIYWYDGVKLYLVEINKINGSIKLPDKLTDMIKLY